MNHLNGLEMIELLGRHGWTSIGRRTYTRDAWEAARDRIIALAAKRTGPPQGTPPPTDDPSGVHLFAKK